MEYYKTKTILNRIPSPDSWFGANYNMNLYRGCSHGCIYCDSRATCFGIKNFDKVIPKENALQILRDELKRKIKRGIIATGAMCDHYTPLENNLKITRNALELLNAFEFGFACATKSSLIARDIDILSDINYHSPVIIKFSITTSDDDVSKKIERNVDASSIRFEAMAKLSDAKIFTGTTINPVLPFITDTEENIIKIIKLTKEAGGKFVHTFMGMTLREGSREYYYNKIPKEIKEKYTRYGNRYNISPISYKKLWGVFIKECEKQGMLYSMKAITHNYKNNKKLYFGGII